MQELDLSDQSVSLKTINTSDARSLAQKAYNNGGARNPEIQDALEALPLFEQFKVLEHILVLDAKAKINVKDLSKTADFLRGNKIKFFLNLCNQSNKTELISRVQKDLFEIKDQVEILHSKHATAVDALKEEITTAADIYSSHLQANIDRALQASTNHAASERAQSSELLETLIMKLKDMEPDHVDDISSTVTPITQSLINTLCNAKQLNLIPDDIRLTCIYIRKACLNISQDIPKETIIDYLAGYFITRFIGPLIYPELTEQLYDPTPVRNRALKPLRRSKSTPGILKRKSFSVGLFTKGEQLRAPKLERQSSLLEHRDLLKSKDNTQYKPVVIRAIHTFYANPIQKLATSKLPGKNFPLDQKNQEFLREALWGLSQDNPQIEKNIWLRTCFNTLRSTLLDLTEKSDHERQERLKAFEGYNEYNTTPPRSEDVDQLIVHIDQVLSALDNKKEIVALKEIKLDANKLKKQILNEWCTTMRLALLALCTESTSPELSRKSTHSIFFQKLYALLTEFAKRVDKNHTLILTCHALTESTLVDMQAHVFKTLSSATHYKPRKLRKKINAYYKNTLTKQPEIKEKFEESKRMIIGYFQDPNRKLDMNIFKHFMTLEEEKTACRYNVPLSK